MGTVRKINKNAEIVQYYYEPADNSERENSIANLYNDIETLIKFAEANKDNKALTRDWCCVKCGLSYRAFLERVNYWKDKFMYPENKVSAKVKYWEELLSVNRQEYRISISKEKVADIVAHDVIDYGTTEAAAQVVMPAGITIHLPK